MKIYLLNRSKSLADTLKTIENTNNNTDSMEIDSDNLPQNDINIDTERPNKKVRRPTSQPDNIQVPMKWNDVTKLVEDDRKNYENENISLAYDTESLDAFKEIFDEVKDNKYGKMYSLVIKYPIFK